MWLPWVKCLISGADFKSLVQHSITELVSKLSSRSSWIKPSWFIHLIIRVNSVSWSPLTRSIFSLAKSMFSLMKGISKNPEFSDTMCYFANGFSLILHLKIYILKFADSQSDKKISKSSIGNESIEVSVGYRQQLKISYK